MPTLEAIIVKPLTPQLNTSNPLTKNLGLDANFTGGGITKMVDLANKIPANPTQVNQVNTPFGGGLQFTPPNSNISYKSPLINNFVRFSFESLFLIRAFTTAAGMRIGGKAAWSCNVVTNGINPDKSMQFFANWSVTTGDWYTPVASFAVGTWYHFVATYDSAATTNAPVMYINGAQQTLTNGTTPAGSYLVDAASDFIIGNNVSFIRGWDGIILYDRYWNRILSSDEVRSLYKNPFGIYFSPRILPVQKNTGVQGVH